MPSQDMDLGEPKPRKVRKKRNWLKHRRTKTELASMCAFYNACYSTLISLENLARDGMTGWKDSGDGDGDQDFLLASFTRGHAQKGRQYRLPKAVMKRRHKIGCERYGKIPFATNQGLGLFDKFGNRLPIYPRGDGNDVIVWRRRSLSPRQYILNERRRFVSNRKETRMSRPAEFPETLPVRLPQGARSELAKVAASRYVSACAVARQAIMAEIEKARKTKTAA